MKEVVVIKGRKEEISWLSYDVIFKSVFMGEENVLAKMISDITEIDYNLLRNNITIEAN